MKYNIEIEDYMECKQIKYKIEKIIRYGRKVYELESEKTIALNNEDYSKALKIKNLVDKMKIDILNISNLNTSKMSNNKLILSDRYLEDKYPKKIIEPLLNNIKGKPKIYKLNIINEKTINYNDTEKDPKIEDNITNSLDNIFSHDETLFPTVVNKYIPKKMNSKQIMKQKKKKENLKMYLMKYQINIKLLLMYWEMKFYEKFFLIKYFGKKKA